MFRLRLRTFVVLFTLWRRLPPRYRRMTIGLVRRYGMTVVAFGLAAARRRAAQRLRSLRR
jgi:hypothetical protein